MSEELVRLLLELGGGAAVGVIGMGLMCWVLVRSHARLADELARTRTDLAAEMAATRTEITGELRRFHTDWRHHFTNGGGQPAVPFLQERTRR